LAQRIFIHHIHRGMRPSTTWEGLRESRRCSRDTYPGSYITEYRLAREKLSAQHVTSHHQTCKTRRFASANMHTRNASRQPPPLHVRGPAKHVISCQQTFKKSHFASSGLQRRKISRQLPPLHTSLRGVPREQKMLKGHLSRVMYHQV